MRDDTRYMLISKDRKQFAAIDGRKVRSGRFYTTAAGWLLPQVIDFIRSFNPREILDPFAGRGDLLRHVASIIPGLELSGFDIDPAFGFPENDSLIRVPRIDQGVIVTNPPYLAKHSAKRKRVFDDVELYYRGGRNDLYQVALDTCLSACEAVVAVIPETFLNSGYSKERLASVSIAEGDLFTDTDCPVCVACFDGAAKPLDQVDVYRDDSRLGSLADFEASRLEPRKHPEIRFNDPDGHIVLYAVDSHDPARPIRFGRRDESEYPVEMIKVSSRLITFLSVPSVPEGQIDAVVAAANARLGEYRDRTCDVVLSPFKGNRHDGRRRRRLDYGTARAILEQAIEEFGNRPAVVSGTTGGDSAQGTLFG